MAKKTTKTTKNIATSYEIAKDLFIVRQVVSNTTLAKPVESNVNHVALIDCSGSMSGDLPQIRDQLKRKLPKLLKEGDTFSLIWFSGRGEFGALLEAEPVATLKDLSDVNKAIDRWLRPIGLTGFKEPILEVEKLVARVGKKNKNPFALFFMSDGCDNQWNRADVLKAVEQTAGGLASSTFVEYGYYADRALLAAMAAKAGGSLIFADAFDKYEPMFEAAMQRHAVGGKRVEIDVEGDPIGGFVFALGDDEIVTYEVGAKTAVPEDTSEVFYLSPSSIGTLDKSNPPPVMSILYAAMSLYAVRMQPSIVFPLLKAVGDVRFIKEFASCFGKQKYSEFMDAAKAAAFNPSLRFTEGCNPDLVPPDDAFTVLDLINVLASDDSTRLLLEHSEFKYSRVSRGRVTADENLSADESEELEALRAKMAHEKSAKKLKEIQLDIDKLLAMKRDALVFTPTPAPDGYPINGLVYNEDRANISLRVLKPGTVDISKRLDEYGVTLGVPDAFPTQIWRNYTLVRDGLVNIERLPVHVSRDTFNRLLKANVDLQNAVQSGDGRFVTVVVNVKPLPIINRKMATAPSALELAQIELKLIESRCAQKVTKAYLDEKYGLAKTDAFDAKYGEDGAAWLKEQGITEGGFHPKMVVAESKDFYMGRELAIAVKGYSTIPSVNALKKKTLEGKKLNGPESIMAEHMLAIEQFLKSNPTTVHEKWLRANAELKIAETRGLLHQAAMTKFAILVGQVWFREFSSINENVLTVQFRKVDTQIVFDLREVEIHI